MDCDLNVRLTRSGKITQEFIVLPDADISDPVTDSDDDLPLWLKSTAELTSEDEETEIFSKAEFRIILKVIRNADWALRDRSRAAQESSLLINNRSTKQHLVFHVFCVNHLNISAITSIHHFLKLIVEQSHYVYSTQLPRYPMYWSTELRCDAIPEAVTRNRFRKKPFLQYQYFSVRAVRSSPVTDEEPQAGGLSAGQWKDRISVDPPRSPDAE
ncbi:ERAD-associated E3 ubiquitin-protein ligase [Trichinella spiralis]|uniref:ERAD-associated E3 ubiquitin-protein ligase n=1 Tax=Trichinella spiralis TaxID=6334 RepID=A0ABR3K1R0_TRISP